MSALTLTELALVYAIPLAALLGVWLASSLIVYSIARLGARTALRADLLHKIEARQRLRSGKKAGKKVRLSYRHVAISLLGDNCVQAVVLYRLSRFFVRHRLRPLARATHAFAKLVTHVDISPRADIGPGLYLYHGLGTVIGKGTRLGSRAVVCQNVTTGAGPMIGDDVKLWAGAKVLGRVQVGDRVEVGANAVVLADVPSDSIAVGVPARVVPRGRQLAGFGAETESIFAG